MKRPKVKVRRPLQVRGFDGSEESRRRHERLLEPRDGTWSQLPAAAVRDRSLGPCTPLHVLAWLCKYRNTKTLECFPANERTAAELGVTVRTIQRHMAKLIEHGHVVVVPRRSKVTGRQTSNQYFVLYKDLPTPPDREEPSHPGQEASESQNTPGEPVLASERGVTCSVIPEPEGVMRSVTPASAESAVGGDAQCRGGVTRSVARGDVECHPNYPTHSIPLNYPSAEAGATAHDAAEDRHDGNLERGEADMAPARHEGGAEAARSSKQPPSRDRLAEGLKVVAQRAGLTLDIMWTMARNWQDQLVAAGFDEGSAREALTEAVRRVPMTYLVIERLKERVAILVQDKMKAAA